MLVLATISERLWQAWAFVSTGQVVAIIGGVGFAVLALLLLFATRTRWGHSKPLTKCIVLSVLAHVWLLMYAMGERRVLPQGSLKGHEQNIQVVIEPESDESLANDQSPEIIPRWEQPVALADLLPRSELEANAELKWDAPDDLLTEIAPLPLPQLPDEWIEQQKVEAQSAKDVAVATSVDSAPVDSPPPPSLPEQSPTGKLASTDSLVNSAIQPAVNRALPKDYQLRQAANRLEVAQAYGADEDSEAAVSAGLAWLAAMQSKDGSWNAARFGAGTETRALGEDRHGTGDRADTGVSGLALLALLSAGHTHVEGQHRQVVQRGLTYLLRSQMPSGDLSGPKQIGNDRSVVNARMYCHSIAMLALAEAHAMTGDQVVRESLLKAAQFTINSQDARGGGWRYSPGDAGDLSLFGWKAMALSSIQRSGIAVPPEVGRRMRYFLDSCSAGKGGLARYRPGEGFPSETMTAEALACRLLLDFPLSAEARIEATEMIMKYRPGVQADNVYFWYYATLALFQLQDENWRIWNQALKARLLDTQVPTYHSEAGSWNPDTLWGGYGGRVYSTAMSCLCLEVYYRYLPLYQKSNIAGARARKDF